MSKKHEFVKAPQRSPEWLELRRQGLGASDMAAVMGVSPYKTPYQLWAEKTGATPEQKVGAAANRGVILEDAVARREVAQVERHRPTEGAAPDHGVAGSHHRRRAEGHR